MTDDFSVYLPQAESPSPWQLDILGAGSALIKPGESYPPASHPTDHLFDWSRGRVLDEFQAIFVSKGGGTIESDAMAPISLRAPFLFLIFPGIRHRYRPHTETGWHERWIGFRGTFADRLLEQGVLDPRSPVYRTGHSEQLLSQIQLIQDEVRSEALGFRAITASALMQILALATHLPLRSEEETQPMREVIRRACFLMRERSDETVQPEALARELHVGYTYFRRLFRKYTGISPKRYHDQLRLQRARRFLRETPRSVSEISDALGFNSPFHMSNWFKKQTGLAPRDWRAGLGNANG